MTPTTPGVDFSQKWRKQQACDRCRRFKVRCQYESPEDTSCIRCTKANADCAITNGNAKAGGGGASGAPRKRLKVSTTSPASLPSNPVNSSPSYACEECSSQKRPIISHEERVERMHLLERRIRDANEEISMLKSIDFNGDKGVLMSVQLKFRQQQAKNESLALSTISSFVNPPIQLFIDNETVAQDVVNAKSFRRATWLPPVRMTKFNCVELAIKYGFYTNNELQNFFELYVTDLALYLPFPITDRLPFNEMSKASPLLTIAAVTCSALCSTTEKAVERTAYLERVVSEVIFIERDLSLELQMVLIMMSVFVCPKDDRQAPFQLLTSLAVSLSLDLGSDDDIRILNDANSSPEEVDLAFKRTRSYISLCTCIAGMALNSARQRLLQVMSHCERCCEALLPRCPDYDKPIVYLLKMMLFFNASIAKLRDPYEPFSSLLNHYEQTKKSLETLFDDCKSACLDWLDRRYFIPIQSSYNILLQSLNECMLSRLAMLDTTEPQFRQLWYRFADEIKRIARVIIDGFLELSTMNSRFPKFMYFRPLHALTSLIRLRLISWSMRLDIEIDVEKAFKLTKAAWIELNKTSHVGSTLFIFLTKVEAWMNIKLGHSSPQQLEFIKAAGGSRSTVDTLHRIMKEVITNDSFTSKKKRQDSLQSTGSAPGSAPISAPISAITTSSPTPIPNENPTSVPRQTPVSLPLATPFPPLAALTMPQPKKECDNEAVCLMAAATTSRTIDSITQSPQLPQQHTSLTQSPQHQQQQTPQSQISQSPHQSTQSTQSTQSMITQSIPHPINLSPSPTNTDTSTNQPSQSSFTNIYMSQYDIKELPVIDNGLLPMMYVDETTDPGQPNDIEFLLKELFNEVNSASI